KRLFEIFGATCNDQRCSGIERSNVAESAALALEHVDERLRVLLRAPTAQRRRLDSLQSELLRRDLEGANRAVLERGDIGRPSRGDLVESVRAMHHPDRLGAEIFQHLGQRLYPLP